MASQDTQPYTQLWGHLWFYYGIKAGKMFYFRCLLNQRNIFRRVHSTQSDRGNFLEKCHCGNSISSSGTCAITTVVQYSSTRDGKKNCVDHLVNWSSSLYLNSGLLHWENLIAQLLCNI